MKKWEKIGLRDFKTALHNKQVVKIKPAQCSEVVARNHGAMLSFRYVVKISRKQSCQGKSYSGPK